MIGTHYEVFALTSTQTDVLTFDTLEEATAEAEKWAKQDFETTIVVNEVTEKRVLEVMYKEEK